MRSLLQVIRGLWRAEEDLRMRRIAHGYAQRAEMDGHVIRKTGEVVPKESA